MNMCQVHLIVSGSSSITWLQCSCLPCGQAGVKETKDNNDPQVMTSVVHLPLLVPVGQPTKGRCTTWVITCGSLMPYVSVDACLAIAFCLAGAVCTSAARFGCSADP